MTERVSQPFTSYNASSVDAKVLTGNWYEERCLKDATGITRNKTASSLTSSAASQGSTTTIYAVHQKGEGNLETHPRVIEHSAKADPPQWASQVRATFQDPVSSNQQQPMRYVNTPKMGPREQRELQQLLAQSLERPASPAPQALYTTSHQELLPPHSLEGMQIGARVMKTQDGGPVQRDITFLAEARIVPRALIDRLQPDAGSLSGATQTLRLADQSEAVTLYSEAAAKQELGKFNGTGSLGRNKTRPMNRADFFTKLPGDVNQLPDDQL